MYNEIDRAISKNIFMMFITPAPEFAESVAEQQLIGWHMAHVSSQLPFMQLSYEKMVVNPYYDMDTEIQEVLRKFRDLGVSMDDHVIPCIFTNYKELKRPVTSQIKPLFSYSEDMKKIMGAPYSGVIVVSGKDAARVEKRMSIELNLIMQNSLRQYRNFRILYHPTDDAIGGVYVNIYLSNYYISEHIERTDEDAILSATKSLVSDCDILNAQLQQYLISRRLHQSNKMFQSSEGRQYARVKENDLMLSVAIKHDIIDTKVATREENAMILFERDTDSISDVANYFGITDQIGIVVENIDKKENRFTTKFSVVSKQNMAIDLATFEEFLYVLKKSYEFQIYNYVTYSDTELYKYSDFQPVDIQVTPKI